MSADRTLVTGGAGFIGSAVVRALLARGEKVTVLDNLSTGHARNIEGLEGDLVFHRGGILQPNALATAMQGVRYVIHLAAQVSVPHSMNDPLFTHETNATGTLRVFEEARRRGDVDRVVYAATCAIYGDDPTLPKTEDSPLSPQSPYAVAKYMGEQYGRAYSREMGLEVVSLRFFNVFGPRQDPSGGYAAVIPVFISLALDGKTLMVHGDGEQTRDFVYVENVAAGLLAARTAEGVAGDVFNIGTGVQTSLNDLVRGIEAALGHSIETVHTEPRAGDVRHSVANVVAAQTRLGYVADVDLVEGLKRTVAFYQGARQD